MPSVDVGVVSQFLHPPIGLLGVHLDYNGPYTGLQTLTQWGSTPGPTIIQQSVSNTFGVQVNIDGAIPSGWGFTYGWVSSDGLYDESTYDQRICQLVVQHQFVSGSWISTQIAEIHSFPTVVMWQTAIPGRIGLLVAPGLAVDLSFLLVN